MAYMRSFLILSLALLAAAANAKEWQKVSGAGKWDVVGSTTIDEAKERALFEAKKDAMRNAGVGTEVSSLSFSAISGGGENYSDDFSQINYFRMCADVRVEGSPRFTKQMEGDIFTVRCEITAKVALKEKNHDPAFRIEAKGAKRVYQNGENITFTVKPTKDCYLRVFWIDDLLDGSGSLLYPAPEYDSDIQLKATRTYTFPLTKEEDARGIEIDYTAQTTKNRETNYILILATAEQEAFVGDVNFNTIFRWMEGIDAKKITEWKVIAVEIVR